jgi:hypothetical protein
MAGFTCAGTLRYVEIVGHRNNRRRNCYSKDNIKINTKPSVLNILPSPRPAIKT